MENNVQIYERRYNNIFDLLSEIGGVIQSIFYLFFWINYIFNKYIIVYDTNSLFFAVKENGEKNLNNNSNKAKNATKLKRPVRKFETIQNLNKEKRAKLKIFEYDKKSDNNNKKRKSILNNEYKNKKDDSKIKYSLSSINIHKSLKFQELNYPACKFGSDENSSNVYLKENGSGLISKMNKKGIVKNENNQMDFNVFSDKMNKSLTEFVKKEEINKFCLSRESLAKINHKNIEVKNMFKKEKIMVKRITFFGFLKDLIFYNNKGSINFLIKFRKHLLSEEHIFKSHAKVVILEKQINDKKNNSVNIFEFFREL